MTDAMLQKLSFKELLQLNMALDLEVLSRTWFVLVALIIIGAIVLWRLDK